jgi:hypothetical protein
MDPFMAKSFPSLPEYYPTDYRATKFARNSSVYCIGCRAPVLSDRALMRTIRL